MDFTLVLDGYDLITTLSRIVYDFLGIKMLRGIFCHDLPIYKDINGVYCSTTMTDDLFSRYMTVCDELVVATRVYPIDKTYEEAHQERISLPNLKFLDLPNLNTFSALFGLISKYRKIIEKEVDNCDLIFIRGGINALLGVDAARKLKKPYLVESSGCAWDSYWNHSFSGKCIAPYMEYRARRDTKEADFVVYVTEKWLQGKYPTNGKWTYASNVILKGVEGSALPKRQKKLATMDKKRIVVGTTAGINLMKGQQFVVEAMRLLKNELDIRYELVGSGNTDYLKSLIDKYGLTNKVFFKGQLSHNEVLAWLDSLDLYVQPSLQEGLPRSVIEAMSRACPVLGSRTAGIPELIAEECVFERKNPTSIAATICDILAGNKMEENAVLNFNKSKEYILDKLNERRNKLYLEYRDYATRNK